MEHSNLTSITIKNQKRDDGLHLFFDDLLAGGGKGDMAAVITGFIARHVFRLEDYIEVAGTYSRTIVSQPGNGFEAMIARWPKKTVTSIHGHPDYAFYYCLTGRIGVEHFVIKDSGLERVSSKIMQSGEYYSVQGKSRTFENAIHRITALEESLSLHVYSDDPAKGHLYSSAQISLRF